MLAESETEPVTTVNIHQVDLVRRPGEERSRDHTVNIHQAKTHLSRLLAEVARGEEVIISRAGTPIARLGKLPYTAARPRRSPWVAIRGLFEVPGRSFDASTASAVAQLESIIESFER